MAMLLALSAGMVTAMVPVRKQYRPMANGQCQWLSAGRRAHIPSCILHKLLIPFPPADGEPLRDHNPNQPHARVAIRTRGGPWPRSRARRARARRVRADGRPPAPL
eukprot:scaffold127215_cov28-Tisochrysis_lutea.AAC.2